MHWPTRVPLVAQAFASGLASQRASAPAPPALQATHTLLWHSGVAPEHCESAVHSTQPPPLHRLATPEQAETALELVWDGTFEPEIRETLPMSEAARAHEIIEERDVGAPAGQGLADETGGENGHQRQGQAVVAQPMAFRAGFGRPDRAPCGCFCRLHRHERKTHISLSLVPGAARPI